MSDLVEEREKATLMHTSTQKQPSKGQVPMKSTITTSTTTATTTVTPNMSNLPQHQHQVPCNVSVGSYLASYLCHLGVDTLFCVPGDLNMTTLDEILKPIPFFNQPAHINQPGVLTSNSLRMINCCNELNAAYAADGYARARGLSALLITHSVGTLSAANGVAGMYSERIPCIVINGSPNTNVDLEGESVHHSLNNPDNTNYILEIYKHITCDSVTIKRPKEAISKINRAIRSCIHFSKPVLIDIPCNVGALFTSSITPPATMKEEWIVNVPLPSIRKLALTASDPQILAASVNRIAKMLNNAKSPVLVIGPLSRYLCMSDRVALINSDSRYTGNPYMETSSNPLWHLIELYNLPFATQADSKNFLPDAHANHLGVYIGKSSIKPGELLTPGAGSTANKYIDSIADLVIYIGCLFTDYGTGGHTYREPNDSDMTVSITPDSVRVCGAEYVDVKMHDVLFELTRCEPAIQHKKWTPLQLTSSSITNILTPSTSAISFEGVDTDIRNKIDKLLSKYPIRENDTDRLTSRTITSVVQKWIDTYYRSESGTGSGSGGDGSSRLHVVADCGDAWFHALKLKLPKGSSNEIQLNYASIGTSIGWTLGKSIALQQCADILKPKERVLTFVGDGSLQMTVQELGSIIRYQTNPIIILINNKGYEVEQVIHKGPYNVIGNWNYCKVVQGMIPTDMPEMMMPYVTQAVYVSQLKDALENAYAKSDRVCFIECVIESDDCHEELLTFGNQAAIVNKRPEPVIRT